MKEQFQINEEMLWDYADGLLPEAETAFVRDVLESSEQWSAVLADIQAQKQLFSELPKQSPRMGFSANVMAAWNSEQSKVAQRRAKKDHLLQGVFWFMGTMLVGWLLIFVYALFRSGSLGIEIPPITVATSFTQHPAYLYSLLLVGLVLVVLIMDRTADFKISFVR